MQKPFLIAVLLLTLAHGLCAAQPAEKPPITSPPESLELDPFYKKHIDSEGLPIVSSEKVADAALLKVHELTGKMLADRPDIRKAIIEANVRFVIIGAKEQTTDIPEYSHMKPKAFWDERARGFGGRIVSCGEENLLCYPVDKYDDENILIHEFAHVIHGIGLRRIDKDFNEKLKQLYDSAIAKGLWKYAYAGSNPSEYWAEGVQSWYDSNRRNNYNHNHVNTREELKTYDPDLALLIEETFRHTQKTDWRYKPVAKQPQVTTPPESLNCDPFYKKYVRVRGLPVLGSAEVSDEALMEANYLIRQIFAYRHDILKAIIDADLRFVVIGKNERVADIPEYRNLTPGKKWDKRRIGPPYNRRRPIISSSEENLLNSFSDRHAGQSILIREFARALHIIAGRREIDENFEKGPKQQYELHVKRLDKTFDEKIEQLYRNAIDKGLWKNTLAAKSRSEYWAQGVQSWFDANTQDAKGHNHVNTREELEAYDPDLADLIAEVFRHTERVDWRYQPPAKRKP